MAATVNTARDCSLAILTRGAPVVALDGHNNSARRPRGGRLVATRRKSAKRAASLRSCKQTDAFTAPGTDATREAVEWRRAIITAHLHPESRLRTRDTGTAPFRHRAERVLSP
jgi:hypothetical protein